MLEHIIERTFMYFNQELQWFADYCFEEYFIMDIRRVAFAATVSFIWLERNNKILLIKLRI